MNIDKSIWLQFPLWGVRKQVHNTKSSFSNTKAVIHSTEHPVDTSYLQHTRCSLEQRENRFQIAITWRESEKIGILNKPFCNPLRLLKFTTSFYFAMFSTTFKIYDS